MLTDIKNLPALDDYKYISQEQIHELRENGHVLIRNILSPGRNSGLPGCDRESRRYIQYRKTKIEERDTFGKAFLQVMNLWRNDERVKKFVMAKRFGRMAADLLGVENVRIYHDQALFKEPGGGPTPWHQDQFYWPVDTANTITMWMPWWIFMKKWACSLLLRVPIKREMYLILRFGDESEPDYDRIY